MLFIDDDQHFGNHDLFETPIVSFLAANDTPEELWPRVEKWLENEIYGTDKTVLSHFETPFEKRVLQLLLEHNHPLILYTYQSTDKTALRELCVSPSNPNRLVLKYRPADNVLQSAYKDMMRMVVTTLAYEFITIGATADSDILTILDLHRKHPETPHRML